MKFMHQMALATTLVASVAQAQMPAPAQSPAHSPAPAAAVRGEAKVMVASKSVAVEYGRPVLAGRDMLGQAKVGTPWRMGSGSPTSLKTEADLSFGAVTLPKGSYVLTAVKDDKGSWNMIATEPVAKTKVAEVPLTSTTVKDPVETFTIELTGKGNAGELAMVWGTSRMAATFTGK